MYCTVEQNTKKHSLDLSILEKIDIQRSIESSESLVTSYPVPVNTNTQSAKLNAIQVFVVNSSFVIASISFINNTMSLLGSWAFKQSVDWTESPHLCINLTKISWKLFLNIIQWIV